MGIKFRWVGLNRKFNEIQINEGLTTTKLIEGEVLSFFNESNRGESGNCKFISEDLFTGLKDKNNKDIYEGDLIPDDIGDVYEVVFRNGAFMWAGEFLGYHLWGNPDCDVKIEACEAIDLEVIGNIHEDSELIKTTS